MLEHAGHQLDLDLREAEVAEHQQRVVAKLLLVHAVPLQRRDHVLDQRVLRWGGTHTHTLRDTHSPP